jgi:hypothetical protein
MCSVRRTLVLPLAARAVPRKCLCVEGWTGPFVAPPVACRALSRSPAGTLWPPGFYRGAGGCWNGASVCTAFQVAASRSARVGLNRCGFAVRCRIARRSVNTCSRLAVNGPHSVALRNGFALPWARGLFETGRRASWSTGRHSGSTRWNLHESRCVSSEAGLEAQAANRHSRCGQSPQWTEVG